MDDFTGQTIVITGASSGIGRATTQLLLERGARVVAIALPDRDLDVARAEIDGDVLFIGADVSRSSEVERAFEMAGELGPIKGVLNGAGISRVTPTIEMTDEAWNLVLSVNLTGAFNVARRAARELIGSGGGSLVLIGSELALMGQAGLAAYTATKGGVLAMARSLAAELASRGVRVNTLSPGPTDTPMLAAEFADETERRRDEASIPLKRFATSREIAEGAAWLLGDHSSYVTGSNLVIDGGRTSAFPTGY